MSLDEGESGPVCMGVGQIMQTTLPKELRVSAVPWQKSPDKALLFLVKIEDSIID